MICIFFIFSPALFAFDLYDKDSSGVIDSNEVKLMLKEIYGANYTQNVHATRFTSLFLISPDPQPLQGSERKSNR
jgi:hypothetical protein